MAKKSAAKKSKKKAKKASTKNRSTSSKASSKRDRGFARKFDPVTAEDASLVLRLYELRREDVMRRSRDKLLLWKPSSIDDLVAIFDFEHPDNAAIRQVSSYFELSFGLARRGAVHPELVAEWCAEGLLLFAKVEPFLAEFRERVSSSAFQHAQWVAENTEWGKQRVEYFRVRFEIQSKPS